MDRQLAMAEAHHARPVEAGGLARRIDNKAIGNVLDHQRVIARRGVGRGEVCENAAAVMRYRGGFPVHQSATHHATAEVLADGLMPETYAEQGPRRLCTCGDQLEANACFIGGAGAGRDEIAAMVPVQRLLCSDGVIADDFDFRAQFHQVMDEVEGEAVVIVDYEDGSEIGHCWRQWRRGGSLSSKERFSRQRGDPPMRCAGISLPCSPACRSHERGHR